MKAFVNRKLGYKDCINSFKNETQKLLNWNKKQENNYLNKDT